MSTVLKFEITDYNGNVGSESLSIKYGLVATSASSVPGSSTISNSTSTGRIAESTVINDSTDLIFNQADLSGIDGVTQIVLGTDGSTTTSPAGTFYIYDTTGVSAIEWCTFVFFNIGTCVISNLNQGSGSIEITNGTFSSTPSGKLPSSFRIVFENGSNYDYNIFSATNNCYSSLTLIPKLTYVKDLKVGDIIRTSKGDLPLSHIMKSNIPTTTYPFVKFSKNCLGNNIPSNDFYISKPHPMSLGLIPNEMLNGGIKDNEQNDFTYLHIEANQFVDKIDGIYIEDHIDNSNYNLIFDEHASINIYGLDVMTHHPVGMEGYKHKKLLKEEYHNKEINNKKFKPFFISYSHLIEFKPENMNLQTFLRKCLTSDKNDKFKFPVLFPRKHNYLFNLIK